MAFVKKGDFMDKKRVKKWLDNLVLSRKKYLKNEYLMDGIRVCTGSLGDGIHIYSGINEIADVMALDLKEKFFGNYDYPYKYWFVYDGVEFFQISNRKLEVSANARTD